MTVALLRSIKQSIVPSDKLLDGEKPIELSENICKSINCYAYALGILYRAQIGDFISFNPGFTSGNHMGWQRDIMKSVEDDLNTLEIPHRLISLDDTVYLEPGEYLVKVFLRKDRLDYHFVRYNPVTETWFHKEGRFQPEQMKVYDKIEDSVFTGEPKSYHFGDYLQKGYIVFKEPA